MAERSRTGDGTIEKHLPEDRGGITVWRNPKNRFVVFKLHFTADPDKRGDEWKSKASEGMPRAEFSREYDLSWESYEGRPVFPDFRESMHVFERDVPAEPGLPLILGWDWGLSPSVSIVQLVGPRVIVLDEVVEAAMAANSFIPRVIEHCNLHYPGYFAMDFVDPAGFTKSQTDLTTCVDFLVRFGRRPVAGEVTFEKRRAAVEAYLTRVVGGRPCLLVNPRCRVTVQGFKGGYHFPERASQTIRGDRPVKNEFSHVMDALQYAVSRISHRMMRPSSVSVREPEYSFVRRK